MSAIPFSVLVTNIEPGKAAALYAEIKYKYKSWYRLWRFNDFSQQHFHEMLLTFLSATAVDKRLTRSSWNQVQDNPNKNMNERTASIFEVPSWKTTFTFQKICYENLVSIIELQIFQHDSCQTSHWVFGYCEVGESRNEHYSDSIEIECNLQKLWFWHNNQSFKEPRGGIVRRGIMRGFFISQ